MLKNVSEQILRVRRRLIYKKWYTTESLATQHESCVVTVLSSFDMLLGNVMLILFFDTMPA